MKRLRNALSLLLVLALVLSLSLTYASAAELTYDNAQSFIDVQVNSDTDTKKYTDEADAVECYNPYWGQTSSNVGYFPFERDTTITVTYLPGVGDTGNEVSEPFVWVALFPYRQQADGSYVSVLDEDEYGTAKPYILTVDGTFEPVAYAEIDPWSYSINDGGSLRGLAPGESVTFTIPFDELGDDLLYEVQAVLSFDWHIDDMSGWIIANNSWRYARVQLDEQPAESQDPEDQTPAEEQPSGTQALETPESVDPSDIVNSTTHLRTSYSENNYLDLSISGTTLTVSGRILLDGLRQLQIRADGKTQTIPASSGQLFSVSFPLSSDGTTPVNVYTNTSGSTFWSLIWNRIYLQKTDGGYEIMPSLVLENNLTFQNSVIDPSAAFDFPSEIPETVSAKAREIVGNETDDYTKVFLLHQWVAENIYYDYDAYYDTDLRTMNTAQVLETRRGVCAGYAALLRDMILSQGIPAIYSSNMSLNSSSYALTSSGGEDHAHTEAYVDGRWIVMDVTWDSNNEYRNGSYITEAPNGFYYFDITPEAFALDHKITARFGQDYVSTGDGFGYSTDGKTILSYDGPGGHVVIPNGVTAIADYAFLNNGDITSLTVPSSVRTIGNSAFEGCYNLTSVTLPDSLTSIGKSAFSRCRQLADLRLPTGSVTIGESAFSSSAITTLTISGGTQLGEGVFIDCEDLQSVIFQSGITSIPYDTFNNCWSIVAVEIPATVTTISERAFVNCVAIDHVYFGGNQNQWAAISIGEKNEHLTTATVHFSSAMPEEPEQSEDPVQTEEPEQQQPETGSPVVSSWAQEFVSTAEDKGFLPDDVLGDNYTQNITRAQFAALAVQTYETLTRSAVPHRLVSFADCSNNVAVIKAYNLGLLAGYNSAPTTSGIYIGPNDPISREQAATMLARLAEALGHPMTAADQLPFTDTISQWAADFVSKVYNAGVMAGTSSTTFSASAPYTIEQSIITMVRIGEFAA